MFKILHHHTKEFYEHLATLFYAVAVADHSIVIEERRKIEELINEHWYFDLDDIDGREIMLSTLNELIINNYEKEEAFLDFKNYFLKHPGEFTPHIRSQILKDASSITLAYSKTNKSESVLISRLYFLLFK